MHPNTHRRTVTRFCDEAGLERDDQIDLAEFIVAARYLGTTATDEQLMETFLEVEQGGDGDTTAKQKLQSLMAEVQARYQLAEPTNKDDEVAALNNPALADDMEWQELHLDAFMREAGQDSTLEIAKNLLLTTSLTPQMVADITGVDVNKLGEINESDSEYETDSDDDSVTQTVTAVSEVKPTVSITADQFNKAILLTQDDVAALDKMLAGGAAAIAEDADAALQILRKFKAAVKLTPEGVKRTKTLRKIVSRRQVSLGVPSHSPGPASKGDSEQKENKLSADGESNKKEKEPKDEPFPRKYRVVIHPGALIKEGEQLNSAEVAKIPIGTVVTVSDIVGRRALITEPVRGWCSVTSKDNRTILQKDNTKSPEMAKAVHAARSRQTKILILKSITTLEDVTVKRILEKSDWNLRRAIEAFYIAKYKTAEFMKKKGESDAPPSDTLSGAPGAAGATESGPAPAGSAKVGGKKKRKKGWFGKWKSFVQTTKHQEK